MQFEFLSSRSASVRTGQCTAGKGAPCIRSALLVAAAALSLGGCASVAPLPDSGLVSAIVSSQPQQPRPPVDLEADGREAQRAPLMRMFPKDDDPTQPFSPNYGEVPLPPPDPATSAPAAPA